MILLEGVNDIGFSQSIGWLTAPHSNVSAAQIIAGYAQMIAQAHAAGVPIFGATLTPFRGARYWTSSGTAKREEVNHWILTSGAFDGVIDFAKAVADPDLSRPASPIATTRAIICTPTTPAIARWPRRSISERCCERAERCGA